MPQLIDPARVVRILHAALLASLTLVGAVFYFVRRATFLAPIAGAALVSRALIIVAAVTLFLATTMLRRRLPERPLGQDARGYWSDGAARSAAIVLWAATEGAGMLGAVGYLLTGGAALAGAFLLALAALVLFRPGRLEGDGAT